jgi:hypothetical protein
LYFTPRIIIKTVSRRRGKRGKEGEEPYDSNFREHGKGICLCFACGSLSEGRSVSKKDCLARSYSVPRSTNKPCWLPPAVFFISRPRIIIKTVSRRRGKRGKGRRGALKILTSLQTLIRYLIVHRLPEL